MAWRQHVQFHLAFLSKCGAQVRFPALAKYVIHQQWDTLRILLESEGHGSDQITL